MKILKTVTGLAAAAAVSLFALSASAQNYPERNITMVVPFAAGGPTDTVARLVAESMSKDLGQQIIVENVGGAGGTQGRLGMAADGFAGGQHQQGPQALAAVEHRIAHGIAQQHGRLHAHPARQRVFDAGQLRLAPVGEAAGVPMLFFDDCSHY